MRLSPWRYKHANSGFTLIETIVFMVVISIALVALVRVFTQSVANGANVDPIIRTRALELAQAQMDEIIARNFDEATPPGGIPACNSSLGIACAGVSPDGDFDDIGDYNGNPTLGGGAYNVNVSVADAGGDLGLTATNARLVTVTVSMPGGDTVTLASYRTNF